MADLTHPQILYIIAIASCGTLLLGGGMAFVLIAYQKKVFTMKEEYARKMIELQMDSQEQERNRIASELHDSVSSLLVSAKLVLAMIERSPAEEGKKSFADLSGILDQSIETVRKIAREITPHSLQREGLSSSVASLCSHFDGRGIRVRFEDHGAAQKLDDKKSLFVYRIVQELITNTVKHAEATDLLIVFNWTTKTLMVEVTDNGKGFDMDEKNEGVGWWNIRNRAAQLHARIKTTRLQTNPGTCVSLEIPTEGVF